MGAASGGRIFPEFTVFIPKNCEYLVQLSVVAKMAIRGAKLTFGGGTFFLGVQKTPGGAKAYKKNQKKVATFFMFFGDSKIFVLCRGAI